MTTGLTTQQQNAVNALVGDVVVQAGAGSGKTRVLAHRFVRAAAHAGGDLALDRILTITFSNKAAGEVAERVRRALVSAFGAAAGDRIEEAWVSTIHSFCGRIARRHVLEAGLDPYALQLDAADAYILKSEVFSQLIEEEGLRNPLMEEVLAAYSLKELPRILFQIHDKCRSMGLDPEQITAPTREGLDELADHTVQAFRTYSDALGRVKQTPTVQAQAEIAARVTEALRVRDWESPRAVERLLETLKTVTGRPAVGDAKDAQFCASQALECLTEALEAVSREDVVRAVEELMREFSRRYRVAKLDRGALDFDDLQEITLRLLETNPAIAARYRGQFDYLMVDEFQDTNEVQMRVLAALRRNNLCVVGDERQSIYGFRHADVAIFREMAQRTPQTLRLATNFRSLPEIMNPINELFAQSHLFGVQFMQLEPGRLSKGDLAPGRRRLQCLFVDQGDMRKEDARRAEASAVADRIGALIGDGRAAEDIVILLRNATNARLFAEALEARGISVSVSAGVGLYDAPEAAELATLLRAVTVPDDDGAMLAMLAGRAVGISDAALAGLRAVTAERASTRNSLFDGVCGVVEGEAAGVVFADSDRDAIIRVHEAIERLTTLQGVLSLSGFVIEACEAFDYDLTLAALPRGAGRAWANILKFAAMAESFERARGRDMAEFLAYLKVRAAVSDDAGVPEESQGGSVRIMTIHSSKGLEFPVVFVADLGTSKRKDPPDVLLTRSTEDPSLPLVGLKFGTAKRGRVRTALHRSESEATIAADEEEQKRCLYVALTRAEEVLVVSGVCKLDAAAAQSGDMIDWIREGIRDESGVSSFGRTPIDVAVVTAQATEAEAPAEQSALPPGALTEPAAPDAATCAPEWRPRSVSYSALHLYESCPLAYHARYRLGLAALSRQAQNASATEFGTLAHAALAEIARGASASEACASLASRHALGDESRRRLEDAISGFLVSPAATAVLGAPSVLAEVPIAVPLGSTVLTGSIDLLALTGTSAHVVDYKTGKAPGEGENRDAGYELQARCYALAALKQGMTDVAVTFAFIERPGVSQEYRFTSRDQIEIEAGLLEHIGRISACDMTHLEAYAPWPCDGCVAPGKLCPVKVPARR